MIEKPNKLCRKETMMNQEAKSISTPNQRLPRHEDADLMNVSNLSLSNRLPDTDLAVYSPPEGGWVAWMTGEQDILQMNANNF